MPKIQDLTDQVFGQLTVLGINRKGHDTYYDCKCSCGNEIIARASHLKSGNIISCKCQKRSHMLSKHPLYIIWYHLVARCTDPDHDSYKDYGARGITVCDRWTKVENFIEDMEGGYRPGLTLDRRENDKGYSKDNCRWVTMEVQSRNKRNNRIVSFEGQEYVIIDLIKKFKLKKSTFYSRLLRGWDLHKALTTKIVPKKRRKSCVL